MILTFEQVDEILKCDLFKTDENCLAVLSYGAVHNDLQVHGS